MDGKKCGGTGEHKTWDWGGLSRPHTGTKGQAWPGKFPEKYILDVGRYGGTRVVVDGRRLVQVSVMGRIGGDGHKNETPTGSKGRARTRIDSHRTCNLLMCLYDRRMGAEGERGVGEGTCRRR